SRPSDEHDDPWRSLVGMAKDGQRLAAGGPLSARLGHAWASESKGTNEQTTAVAASTQSACVATPNAPAFEPGKAPCCATAIAAAARYVAPATAASDRRRSSASGTTSRA